LLKLFNKIFDSKNKILKKTTKIIDKVSKKESFYIKKTNEELKEEYNKLKNSNSNEIIELLAIIREASKRILGLRPHDSQLIGALSMFNGYIIDMKTGEGKTLTSTITAILSNFNNEKVHIITVNDYLAERDSNEMSPLYNFFDLDVGFLLENEKNYDKKRAIYKDDIVYGSNSVFAFDYLNNNIVTKREEIFQSDLIFAIIDEIDSVLIDESRTPLIISMPMEDNPEQYIEAYNIAKSLKDKEDFNINIKDNIVELNENAIKKIEKYFIEKGIENIYSPEKLYIFNLIDQSLRALHLISKDIDYMVKNDQAYIIDENTGRISEGRRFSDGLHQAIEVKENLKINPESQTIADITYQNFFKNYKKIAGMSGTALTEEVEFYKVYGLQVIQIPTNKPIQRIDKNDLIFLTQLAKEKKIIEEVKRVQKTGQPILLGTVSIEKAEYYHELFKRENIIHDVLSAKSSARESEIISKSGEKGKVTIVTNMAGRGVDIKIFPEIEELGGLYILGTERYDSRRIDNQLLGRSGRQGNKGTSQFMLSLEDSMIVNFGGIKAKNIMETLNLGNTEEPIDSKFLTKLIRKSQKTIEGIGFESRKELLEYDDVINNQRKTFYNFRKKLLEKDFTVKNRINDYRHEYIKKILFNINISPDMPSDSITIKEKENINKAFQETMNIKFNKDFLDFESQDNIKNKIVKIFDIMYTNKMKNIPDNIQKEVEKEFFLSSIDRYWLELKREIDHLKTGIHLRQYNNKEPLSEFKRESYHLFLKFKEDFNIDAVKTLDMITIDMNQE